MQIALRRAIITILLATYTTVTYSAEWKIDPAILFKAGYIDNLRLSIDDKISSAEVTFSPRAIFSVATPTSGISGNVRFDFRRYKDDSNLDDNNSRLDIISFQNFERSRIGLGFNFVKDTTLDSQLEATGLAFGRIRRQSISVSPNWTYTFSNRTDISVNYSYRDVEYKNPGTSRFVNYALNSAQATLTRIVNQKTTASITLSGTQSDNDNNVETTALNLQGGASYRLSETLSASIFIGTRRTETNFSRDSQIPIFSGNTIIGFVPLTQDFSSSGSGGTFSANITKSFLRGEVGLSASRNISNSINGRAIEVTRLSSTNLYRFSETLSASLSISFYKNKIDSDITNSLNRDYYQIDPKFTWAIKKFWSLSGSYRYRKQAFDGISDDATQNAAYLTLTYRWPRIAVSR